MGLKLENLELNKEYPYTDVIMMYDSVKTDDTEFNEHGPDFIGESAIHMKIKDVDYWFLLTRVGHVYYYKFIYK